MSEEQDFTPINVSAKSAYILEAQDVANLRVKHHFMGTLVGTLPGVSQQNVFLGLPLSLMPEEVVIMVSEGIGKILDDTSSYDTPTATQLALLKQQSSAQTPTDANSSTQEVEPTPILPQSARQVLTVTATSSMLPWYSPAIHSSLQSAKESNVWTYPHTPTEVAKVEVFRALWKRGYFLGPGMRFGGDFLVYPGDSLRYHSHFVATSLPSVTHPITPIQLVAWGRLGTATKKAHLISSWDEEKEEVEFFSLEWASF